MIPVNNTFQNECINAVAKGCKRQQVLHAHNLAPFVKLTVIGGNGELITVSNESCAICKPKHSAVIQSMEYASTDAYKLNIVVQDVAGGAFESIVKAMSNDPLKINAQYQLTISWGWTGEKCDQTVILAESIELTFLVTSLVTSFDKGKIVYEIEGGDMFKQMMAVRAYKVQGDDENPIEIQKAIKQMFAAKPQPTIAENKVRFLRRKNDGGFEKFTIHCKKTPNGEKGKPIVGKWEPAQKTKVACAVDWMKSFVTDKGKGCSDYTWDVNEDGEPGIIFWEDNGGCDKILPSCAKVGYYIVNGSRTSPVISFQPKFKWNWTHLGKSGGGGGADGTSDLTAGDNLKYDEDCGDGAKKGEKGQGNQVGGAAAEHPNFKRNCGRNAAAVRIARANVQKQATSKTAHFYPVEADMTIQGNPELVVTQLVYQQWLSIIVVNPFHLLGGSAADGTCPDWTVNPPCNTMMTNSGWYIRGVNHSIRAGTYTTTLKVFLHAPSATKPNNKQLGADTAGTRFGNLA